MSVNLVNGVNILERGVQMDKISIPYLCGGTFLTQILRARKDLVPTKDYEKGHKESHSEQEVFRRLISIYHLTDFHECSSLKPYTSKFKSCTDSLLAFGQFSDNDRHRNFTEDIKSEHSVALRMMTEFVHEFIEPSLQNQLVRCLVDMVVSDNTIRPEDEFLIVDNGIEVKVKDFSSLNRISIEPFLLGVWHYIILNRADKNYEGSETYKEWCPEKGVYRGTVGNGITWEIVVDTISEEILEDKQSNATFDEHSSDSVFEGESNTQAQTIENATIINNYGGKVVNAENIAVLNL